MRDRRRPPFAFQELVATAAIRGRWEGTKRGTALAIYQSMTEMANDARARVGGHDEPFEATRREIGVLAGCSPDTVDRYTGEFEGLGIVEIERRREHGVWLPNLYTLMTPDEANERSGGGRTGAATMGTHAPTPSRTDAARGGRTGAASVNQEVPLRGTDKNPPSGGVGGESRARSSSSSSGGRPSTASERRRARSAARIAS